MRSVLNRSPHRVAWKKCSQSSKQEPTTCGLAEEDDQDRDGWGRAGRVAKVEPRWVAGRAEQTLLRAAGGGDKTDVRQRWSRDKQR
ncbi:hypothetical protein GUJ93_ZPchr0002g26016 [Zizania palustris]|uniref:Uncharacterized protein n=1 Tax=Zizania palustris TaxID=103762 RepID=A0A8J5SP46_ZIZPA|nr:hypothetical protein GUJ93_ZPchr0002g26016 [Zizania palustris]